MSVLSSVVDRVSANPLLGFVPHGGQECFLGGLLGFSGVGSRFYLGGNRSGKTTVGVVDDLVQCLPSGFVPSWLLPFKRREVSRVRYVAPSLKDHVLGVALPKFREWCPVGALLGGSFDSAFDRQRYVLRFVGGSEVQFMSFDMDLNKFGGADLDQVHFDEEPPLHIRDECRVRLWDRGGHEVFTMTPQYGLSWVLDVVEGGGVGVSFVRSSTLDNPHVSHDAVRADMLLMSEAERRVRVFGEFASLSGLVFPGFDVGRNVVGRVLRGSGEGLSVGDFDEVVVGLDPGLSRFAVVFCGFDFEGRCCVFDELYLEDLDVPGVAERVRECLGSWGLGVDGVRFVVDPSARNRGIVNRESVLDALLREGLVCELGENDLTAGVLEMRRRLECGALVVSEGCESWLMERSRYQVDAGSEVDGAGFKVVRRWNHLMDATRYVVMTRPWWEPEEKGWEKGFGFDVVGGRVGEVPVRRSVESSPFGGLF